MLRAEESTDHENSESTEHENADSTDDEQKDDTSLGGGDPKWAKCIANILKSDKPKTKKTLVLSQAKNLNKGNTIKKEVKKPYDFEIEGEIKEEKKPDKIEIDEKVKTIKKEKSKKLKKLNLRVKPSIQDHEREKALKKIATKGVVQLFNAVRTQQKEIEKELEKAGPLDHRKDAVLNNINKRKFLDVLMGGERAKSELVDNPVKEEEEEDDDDDDDDDKKSEWSVLRDDFLTNKKFKHWDQESESSDNNNEGAKSENDATEESDDDSSD